MSIENKIKFRDELIRGLEIAEYRMLREKAMRNQVIVLSDGNGGTKEVSARETFVRLYNEEIPHF